MPTPKGKGGNIDTRRNPFTNGPRPVNNRPNLSQSSDLTTALELVIKAGCAIMLGSTRDQGALVITILDGDDRHRTYCTNDTEFHEAIDAIGRLYETP